MLRLYIILTIIGSHTTVSIIVITLTETILRLCGQVPVVMCGFDQWHLHHYGSHYVNHRQCCFHHCHKVISKLENINTHSCT